MLFAVGCGPGSPPDPHPDLGPGQLQHVDPARSSLVVDRASDVVADGQDAVQVTVTLRDGNGAPVVGQMVALAATGGGNQLSAPLATDGAGVASAVLTSTVAERKTVTATLEGDTALRLSQMPTVEFVAGAAENLAFDVPPSSVRAGEPITPAVVVSIRDHYGNRVRAATPEITISLGPNAGGATIGGNTSVKAVDGVATFAALSVDRAGSGYALVAQTPAIQPRTSVGFDVTAGTPSQLRVVTQPASAPAGSALATVRIEITDAHGNLETQATDAVTVALGNPAGGATLGGTLTVAAVAGVANFADLHVDKVGHGYTLAATATGRAGAASAAFDIEPAAAARLAFATQPSSAVAGVAIAPSFTVRVEDRFGNLVDDASDDIQLALGANPGDATLAGTLLTHAAGGLATFAAVSLDRAHAGYTLVASAGALTPATSDPFAVTPAVAFQLAFLVQPSNAQADAAIAPTVEVAIADKFGNPVGAGSDAITVALGNHEALAGTLTVAAVAGRASFADLRIKKPGTAYTLLAASGSLQSATSSPFDISVGAPARLVFVAQPSNAAAGAPLAPPVQVELQDAAGNRIPTATSPVTIALGAHGAAGLDGTLTINAAAGVATFADLDVTTAGHGYTLTATAPGYAGATSASFDISAGLPSATHSSVSAAPAEVTADGVAQATITVTVRDAHDNPVAGQAVTLAASGSANMLDPAGGTTDGDGKLGAQLVSTAAESKTITATVGAFHLTTSVTFTAGAPNGDASNLSAPGPVVADGVATTTITVQVVDGKGNPVGHQQVTLSVSGSNDVLFASSGLTDDLGRFHASLSSTTAESKQVTARFGPGVSLSTSVLFVAGAPSADHSKLVVSPASLVADGAASATITLTLADLHGNAIADRAVDLSASGSGNTLAPASGNTDAAGAFVARLASTTAEDKTITASWAGGSIKATVTFTPGAPSTTNSTLEVNPTSVIADGTTTATLTLTVRDANANPVAHEPITLSVDGLDNALVPASGFTDATGRFVANLSSKRAETKHVRADFTGGFRAAAVDFMTGPAAKLVFVSQPGNAIAGDPLAAVGVAIEDAQGNVVRGATQQVFLLSIPSTSALKGGDPQAPIDGVVTFSALSLVESGDFTLQAFGVGLATGTSARFHVAAGPPAELKFARQPVSAAAGDSLGPVEIFVRDRLGNLVLSTSETLTMTLRSNPGNGTLLGTTTVNTVNYDAFFSDLGVDKVGAGYTLEVSDGPLKTTSAPFNITAGAPSAGTSTLTADPQTLVVDADSTMTVTVKDDYDNLVANQAVSFTATGDQPSLSAAGGSTDATGQTSVRLSSTRHGVKTVTARVGALFNLHADVTFKGGAPTLVNVTSSRFNVVADGVDATVLTIVATDRYGNPSTGAPVTITSDGSGNTLTLQGATTDDNGTAKATLATTHAETKNLTATVAGVAGQCFATFVPGPASSRGSTLVASPTSLPADGTTATNVTLKLADAFGNPLVNRAVSLTVSGQGPRFADGHTDLGGTFSAPLRSIVHGTRLITATAGDFQIGTAVTFTSIVCDGSLLLPSVPWPDLGTVPAAIASGDFNHDQKPDLVTANDRDGVSVLLARGGGLYQAPLHLALDGSARSVAVGDFDQDGALDIATVGAGLDPSRTANLNVFFGNGDGTFAAATAYVSGANPTRVAAGDFNDDGNDDLVVTNNLDNNVEVRFGRHDRGFSRITLATPSRPDSVAVGDLDGDSYLDFVVGGLGKVQPFFGGSGQSIIAGTVLAATGFEQNNVSVADYDKDHKGDITVASSEVLVFYGAGNRSFAASQRIDTQGPSGLPDTMSSADFDGDGKPDLVVNTSFSWADVFLTRDGRTFQRLPRIALAPNSSSYVQALATADFDGDGRVDLAVTNPSGQDVSLFIGKGDGTFPAPPTISLGSHSTGLKEAVTGDFNGDHHLDVVVTDDSAQLFFLAGNGDGTLRPAVATPIADSPSTILAGDFDADGKLDAATAMNSHIRINYGNGNGTFSSEVHLVVGNSGSARRLVSGDFDGDGLVDIAAVGGQSSVSVFYGAGHRTFAAEALVPSGAATWVVAGDFDVDGNLDFATVNGNGSGGDVTVMFSNGHRNPFAAPLHLAVGRPTRLVAGDFDGSGGIDLAVAGDAPAGMSLLLANRDRSFQAAKFVAHVGADLQGDFNGDGKTDLAWGGATTFGVLAGNQDGSFASPIRFGQVAGSNLVSGDFDGDGVPDFASIGSNGVTVHLSIGCLN